MKSESLGEWLTRIHGRGGQVWLAEQLEVSPQSVSRWVRNLARPADRYAAAIEALSEGAVTYRALRRTPENPLEACRTKQGTGQAQQTQPMPIQSAPERCG